ncbi:MAG: tRNA (cytidine(56)-2'-O)-methyltransferase [Candidatus Micrarchaeia archaeon]
MEIDVLRFGHRKFRDNRASMHVALVARALGARKIIYCGDKDSGLEERVKKISDEWGEGFEIEYNEKWIDCVEAYKKSGGCFVHLTMYGEPVQEHIRQIQKSNKNCLVFVGSQKVPIEAYRLADFNIAVTNQPHSEIAALAVFLDRFFEGAELEKKWKAKREIEPSKTGKKMKTDKK